MAYLYNSPAVIWSSVSRSFVIKAEDSISIDLSINSPEIPTGYSVREGLPTERPEPVGALPEALAEVDMVPGYIVSWEIDLLYFSFTISFLVVLLPVYIYRAYKVIK